MAPHQRSNCSWCNALLLEANPNLTWRDVKHILAVTAQNRFGKKPRPARSQSIFMDSNSAGFEHHKWYGFGRIDADAADILPVLLLLTIEAFTQIKVQLHQIAITDDGANTQSTITITKPSDSNNFVEYIKVQVLYNHDLPKSLGMRLLSPDGTVIPILQPFTNLSSSANNYLIDIGVAGFYGESIEGDWTIVVNDYDMGDELSGDFIGWYINVYGN